MAKKRSKSGLMRIGWKEWVSLPTLGKHGVAWIKAKIDTGARTSALHVDNIELFHRKEREYARFVVHPKQRSNRGGLHVTARILEWRGIRSSNGQLERRPVIETTIRLGKKEWKAEVTLANRDQMGYRMLLGRTSLEGRFAVDCGAEFLGPEPMRRKKMPLILGSKKEEQLRAEMEESGGVVVVVPKKRKLVPATPSLFGDVVEADTPRPERRLKPRVVTEPKPERRLKPKVAAERVAAGSLGLVVKSSPKKTTGKRAKKASKKRLRSAGGKPGVAGGKSGAVVDGAGASSADGAATRVKGVKKSRLRSAARRAPFVFE